MHAFSPTIQRWRSDDIDEQSALLCGWEQDYRQLSCGKFVGKVSTVQGPRMTITGEHTNQSLHQSVKPPAGSLVFALVLNRDDALQIDRRPVAMQSLMVLEGGREYDFRTEGCTELLGILMDADLFLDRSTDRFPDVLARALGQKVVPLEQSATAMLRHFWLMMSAILQNDEVWPGSMPLPLLSDTARSNIALALNMSASQSAPALPYSAERQARVVQQAIAYMRDHLDRPFTMAEVCAAAHVSQRTLQYHFENCLGMAPLKYLKVMRLNAARRALRRQAAQSPEGAAQPSIAEIAAQCGYEHASRFAGDYRRQFGALPSQTLRDAGRAARLAA